jgi:hypothetical protein
MQGTASDFGLDTEKTKTKILSQVSPWLQISRYNLFGLQMV